MLYCRSFFSVDCNSVHVLKNLHVYAINFPVRVLYTAGAEIPATDMDHLTKEKRSWNMSRIGSKNTKPERIVRSALHKKGYRFRLNGKVSRKIYRKGVLPGKPDIVLAKYKTVIFINGCFWHGHKNCKRSNLPKSNVLYWKKKLRRNKERDAENTIKIQSLGWRVIIIWECETTNDSRAKIMEISL